MRANIRKVIDAFQTGRPVKGDSKGTCSTDGQIVYSYAMPIAKRIGPWSKRRAPGAVVIVPREDAPSNTTRSQIDALTLEFPNAVRRSIPHEALIDRQPRYAPRTVIVNGRKEPVVSYVTYPPGQHPEGCPLVATCTALELRTPQGSRWWGVEKAWINAELRMVVSGFPMACEIRRAWQRVAPKNAAGAPRDREVQFH